MLELRRALEDLGLRYGMMRKENKTHRYLWLYFEINTGVVFKIKAKQWTADRRFSYLFLYIDLPQTSIQIEDDKVFLEGLTQVKKFKTLRETIDFVKEVILEDQSYATIRCIREIKKGIIEEC